MGSNPTQAIAIVFMLIGFILLAGALAGATVLAIGALVLLGVAAFFFMKCKPWEQQ